MTTKHLRKIFQELLLMCYMLKSISCLHYLAVKLSLSSLLKGIISKRAGDFSCLNFLDSLEQKRNSNLIKKYVKMKVFVVLQCLPKTPRN